MDEVVSMGVEAMPPEIQELIDDNGCESGSSDSSDGDLGTNAPTPTPAKSHVPSSAGHPAPVQVGGSSSGASSSCHPTPAIPAPMPVAGRLEDIFDPAFGFETHHDVTRLFTEFTFNNRWEILWKGVRKAQINCIEGSSLKVRCLMHTLPAGPYELPVELTKRGKKKKQPTECKMHIDIDGDFARAQVELLMWVIAGCSSSCTSFIDHYNLALQRQEKWRNRLEVHH